MTLVRDLDQPFSIVVARSDTHTVVALRGELDIAVEGELAAGLALVLATCPAVLSIDLRELEFLDSTGIRALITLREQCAELGCHLQLVPGPPAVQRAFEVSGLSAHFTMVDPSHVLQTSR